jgi:hypothetical protein
MAKHHHDGHHDGHHHKAAGGPLEHDGLKHGGHAGHKHHHHKRKHGGRTEMHVSGNPDVFKEAEGKEPYAKGDEKKHGGRAKHHGKHHGKHKHHRAAGGPVKAPGVALGLMTGGGVRPRLDKPGRKAGGRVGADRSPLSSAHRGHGDGHETPSSRDTYGGTPA